jgi:hypothetical protein
MYGNGEVGSVAEAGLIATSVRQRFRDGSP